MRGGGGVKLHEGGELHEQTVTYVTTREYLGSGRELPPLDLRSPRQMRAEGEKGERT